MRKLLIHRGDNKETEIFARESYVSSPRVFLRVSAVKVG